MSEGPVKRLATRAEPYAYAALRIVAGAMFAFHGTQKILGWQSTFPPPAFLTQMWFGGMIELIGGLLVAFGLAARCAAFVASGCMAVAYFQFHWKFVLTESMWLPGVNKGELAALYSFVFLYISTRGAGPLSLHALMAKRKS